MNAREAVGTALLEARRHPRHVVLFALVAGLLCGGWVPLAAGPAALAALALAGRAGLAALAVVAVLGGAAAADARRSAIDNGRLPAPIGSDATVRATLLEPLRERASGELAGRIEVGGEPLLLELPATAASPVPAPGTVLAVSGRLDATGDFDEYQRRRGALAVLRAEGMRPTGERRGGLLGALDTVRSRAEDAFAASSPERESALLAGMVLGRDDLIDPTTQDAFRASGLAHLLAVSGTNVLLLAALAIGIGAVLGVSLRARLAAALTLVALYVPLTGAGPSIQRAGVMGAAGLVAALAGRPSSRVYALGLAAAVTLAINPYAAGDPGWQLSFAAVVGLLTLTGPFRERLRARRIPAPLAEATAITTAATLATAPLLAVHFGTVSLVSLPANLIAAPLVAPIMWLGMLGAAAAQVGLAAPFVALAAVPVALVDLVAEHAATLPFATIVVPLSGFAGVVAGYVMLAVGWRWRRAVIPAVAVVLAVAGFADEGVARPAAGETVVSFLDIGQGDATLVERDGASVLFDTGPAGGPIISRLREVGVERLDALVITHAQDDHEGNALAVIDRFHPRLIVDGGAGWPTAVQRALPGTGVRTVSAMAGDIIRLGPLELDVLSPVERLPPTGDANNTALVVQLRSGDFDLLLPADAESDVTGALDLEPVEALKVAHHGSEDAGLPAQLEQLQPQFAAIEVGRGNDYGHPTAPTLAALRAVPQVFRTDRDGTVQLRVTATSMHAVVLGHD